MDPLFQPNKPPVYMEPAFVFIVLPCVEQFEIGPEL